MMEESIKGPLAKILILLGIEDEFMPGEIHNLRWHTYHDAAGSLTGMKKISQASEHL